MNTSICPLLCERARRLLALLLCVGAAGPALIAAAGCSGSDSDAPPAAQAASSEPVTWTFDSPEAAVTHISSLSTGDDYVALMKHLYWRTEHEEWAAKFAASIADARLEFRELLNVAFGSKQNPVVGTDLGMSHLAQAIAGKPIQPHGKTRVFVEYEEAEGEPAKLVLAKIRDRWQVHATTLSNGEEIDAHWCLARQNRFAAQLKYHRDMSNALRKGMYSSAEEAQQALQQRLDGPPPPRGSVRPDDL